MPDTDSWLIKAIEEKAMERARQELSRTPMTWRYMGFDVEQIRVMVLSAIDNGCAFNISAPEIHGRIKR